MRRKPLGANCEACTVRPLCKEKAEGRLEVNVNEVEGKDDLPRLFEDSEDDDAEQEGKRRRKFSEKASGRTSRCKRNRS